ncbi:glycogen/starch/alpha-glucan phosphorylase [Candidatus Dependentiae bacterium]|nr:glycogen/starch/alpha-glucan phosphorylase [Candidatus Dependentiae bacterium]
MTEKNEKEPQVCKELLSSYRKKMDTDGLRLSITNHLHYTRAKEEFLATDYDKYLSLALAVRDRMVERWAKTQQAYYNKDAKRAYYLSLEFLLGRVILNNIINMNIIKETKYVIKNFGYDFKKIIEQESDAGLGNGGLGRLAACFLDSMATLGLPGYGYGIRYEFGIFNQHIINSQQVEEPEFWLQYGYPWEIERPEYSEPVNFFGEVVKYKDEFGNTKHKWQNTRQVTAIPYDIPIIGYGNNTVNTLRLWAARSSKQFDLKIFNHGDYVRAVEDKNYSENISRVLYPNDNIYEGKELRLKQQYFFVAATLKDIIRRYSKSYEDFDHFPEKVAIQLNDTHPSLAIPELMRIFIDEYNLPWDKSWELTTKTFGFTNHTVLPEALEKWPVSLFQKLLPRHLQIIFDINSKILNKIRVDFNPSEEKISKISLIEESTDKQVRMANLAIVGSHSVNGVAKLHSEIIKNEIFKEFHEIYPDKFNNKTNGITQRRWLLLDNPELAKSISEKIGDKWIRDLYELKKLEEFSDDKEFLMQLFSIKKNNKIRLAKYIKENNGIDVDINSIFNSQTKRMHEYKRQFLNVLHILYLYNKLKENPNLDIHPRTFLFSGKSAPGYFLAKLVIRLINSVGDIINNDSRVRDKIKVVFLENYRVSLAELIIPASDVSEQISTAGKEASGTGNMKYALNGALTIGTLDGANIEIMNEVGQDNIYIFGLKAEEIAELKKFGKYSPWDYYNNNLELKQVVDMLKSGELANGDAGLFRPLYDTLMHGLDGNVPDQYFLLADFKAYVDTHSRIDKDYRDKIKWNRMVLKNIANMGFFSSDRAIKEYASEIWNIKPVEITL